MMRTIAIGILTLLALIGAAPAEDDVSKAAAIFERRCLACHNNKDKKGGLSLATQKDLLAGGESGAVVVAGKPAESLLLDYITGNKPAMPKTGPPLSAEEVAAIRAWIAAGATWPADLVLKDRSLADTNWWSLKPLVRPPVPRIQNPKIKIQ